MSPEDRARHEVLFFRLLEAMDDDTRAKVEAAARALREWLQDTGRPVLWGDRMRERDYAALEKVPRNTVAMRRLRGRAPPADDLGGAGDAHAYAIEGVALWRLVHRGERDV